MGAPFCGAPVRPNILNMLNPPLVETRGFQTAASLQNTVCLKRARISCIIFLNWYTLYEESVEPERIRILGARFWREKSCRAPPLFCSCLQLVVLLSAFVMISTVWSVSCLPFFYTQCLPALYGIGATVKSNSNSSDETRRPIARSA